MGRWGRDEYVHQKEFSMQWNYSEVSVITQLKTMNGLMEEIPVAQQEHPPRTIQWMKNIQTSIVFELIVYLGPLVTGACVTWIQVAYSGKDE